MRQLLYVFGLAVLLSGINTSCKTTSLDTMHDDEVAARTKYVTDKKLTDFKDASGIYFKDSIQGTDTTWVRAGFKVMLTYNITLLNGTVIFTTDDGAGHTYDEVPFYVDVSNTTVNENYVQQIAGLHVGLKKMHIGDTAKMVIPSELAFKAVDNSSLGIPRFSTLLATVYVKRGYSPAQQK